VPTTELLDALIPNQEATQWPSLKDLERRYIEAMLAAQDGDKVAVAAALGVSERSLYRKLSGKK
jgi:transcriptional regulator with PAS, ATPase and Fis domain